MRKTTIRVFGILLSLAFLGLVSCKYDDMLPVKPDPGLQISFADDLIPIFNASCNLSGCHNGSGHAPDLRPAQAYESLWSGSYIDTLAPENSELYLWMTGARGLTMPLEGSNAGYNAKVLQWITQGAPNN
jgi:hypothetical protein